MIHSNFSLSAIVSTIKAVIFDMDGVLVDSESQHYRAHKQAIEEHGGKLSKEFYSTHGVACDSLLFYAAVFPRQSKNKKFLEEVY